VTPINVEHGALGAFKHHALPVPDGPVEQGGGVGNEGPDALRGLRVLVVHLDWVQRVGSEKRVRNSVLFIAGIFNMRLEQTAIKQVNHPQAAAMHLVFVGRTDTSTGSADLLPSGSILRRQLDHAVVGQNHLGPVGDKQLLVDVDPQVAKLAHLFQKGQRVEHHSIADHRPAVRTQNAAGHQLQDKLFSPNDDGMPGIVAACVTSDDRKPIR
jgi:hypothetical protein